MSEDTSFTWTACRANSSEVLKQMISRHTDRLTVYLRFNHMGTQRWHTMKRWDFLTQNDIWCLCPLWVRRTGPREIISDSLTSMAGGAQLAGMHVNYTMKTHTTIYLCLPRKNYYPSMEPDGIVTVENLRAIWRKERQAVAALTCIYQGLDFIHSNGK